MKDEQWDCATLKNEGYSQTFICSILKCENVQTFSWPFSPGWQILEINNFGPNVPTLPFLIFLFLILNCWFFLEFFRVLLLDAQPKYVLHCCAHYCAHCYVHCCGTHLRCSAMSFKTTIFNQLRIFWPWPPVLPFLFTIYKLARKAYIHGVGSWHWKLKLRALAWEMDAFTVHRKI